MTHSYFNLTHELLNIIINDWKKEKRTPCQIYGRPILANNPLFLLNLSKQGFLSTLYFQEIMSDAIIFLKILSCL